MKTRQLNLFPSASKLRRYDEKTPSFIKTINRIIDFEVFRPELEVHLDYKSDKIKGGRPPLDAVQMFKILIIAKFHDYADDRMEFAMHDSLSIQKFLGFDQNDEMPDSKTIWSFRNRLAQNGAFDALFQKLLNLIKAAGFEAKEGQVVDATIIETRRPTSREDDEEIKENAKRQIDEDATFTKKHGKTYHGYKGHIRIDAQNKFVQVVKVTTASTHDSQVDLIDTVSKQDFYGDSAYKSAEMDERLVKLGIANHISYRAYRNKPLTKEQKAINKENSSVRAKVEHTFGNIKRRAKKCDIRCIGMVRATLDIGLKFFIYNMDRMRHLMLEREEKERLARL